ncbi:unnamed protein product [Allacma fusca]|uniref:Uncharacterized protein n=1 Tax=Allacma fusca TaxID=39272 RepID=A0A8J2KFJ5_9HEXA|nr:unnamed protein product [Allacma fusca]
MRRRNRHMSMGPEWHRVPVTCQVQHFKDFQVCITEAIPSSAPKETRKTRGDVRVSTSRNVDMTTCPVTGGGETSPLGIFRSPRTRRDQIPDVKDEKFIFIKPAISSRPRCLSAPLPMIQRA